ncbi:glucose-6-phosphate/phosphate translocator 1, chloroplastic-like [Fagus crenata]
MVCSVIRSVTRTINASDLLLRKESLVPPIIQLLPALIKPAERLVLSVSRPLHVSSVEKLSFGSATKACAWGPSLSLVKLRNISSSSKDDESSWSSSMWKNWKKILHPKDLTKFINDSNSDIEFWVQKAGVDFHEQTLKAKDNDEIYMRWFQNNDTSFPKIVILKANGKCQMKFTPQDFITYQKFVFKMDANGKLDVTKEKRA